MFDAADRQGMLEAIGVSALLQGGETFYVKPPFYPDPQDGFNGMDMESINPYCLAAVEDIDRLNIEAGESGTIIIIAGREYRALSIAHENTGLRRVELGSVS